MKCAELSGVLHSASFLLSHSSNFVGQNSIQCVCPTFWVNLTAFVANHKSLIYRDLTPNLSLTAFSTLFHSSPQSADSVHTHRWPSCSHTLGSEPALGKEVVVCSFHRPPPCSSSPPLSLTAHSGSTRNFPTQSSRRPHVHPGPDRS